MLSVLTETQKAIVETITMRLSPKEALHYLKDVGFEMSRAKYFRHKKKVEELTFERMQHIAMFFQNQHLERIDKCELVEKLMWENYRTGDINRVKILESIISIQPYLSGYYDATRYVLEKRIKAETDLGRTTNPYVSIDLRKRRRREIQNEDMERSRQKMISENNEPIDRTMPKAISDD